MNTQRQDTAQRAQNRARWYHRLLTGFYGATGHPQGSHRTPNVSGSDAPKAPTDLDTPGEPGGHISQFIEMDISPSAEDQFRARAAATRICEVCGFTQYPADWYGYCSGECREHARRMRAESWMMEPVTIVSDNV